MSIMKNIAQIVSSRERASSRGSCHVSGDCERVIIKLDSERLENII